MWMAESLGDPLPQMGTLKQRHTHVGMGQRFAPPGHGPHGKLSFPFTRALSWVPNFDHPCDQVNGNSFSKTLPIRFYFRTLSQSTPKRSLRGSPLTRSEFLRRVTSCLNMGHTTLVKSTSLWFPFKGGRFGLCVVRSFS